MDNNSWYFILVGKIEGDKDEKGRKLYLISSEASVSLYEY